MFAKLPETTRLMEAMRAASRGDVLEPWKMATILGVDAAGSKSPGYAIFLRVAKRLERETSGELCWRWIREDRVYRCLENRELPTDIRGRTGEIRRRARRNVLVSSGVDMNDLTPEQQKRVQVDTILAGAIEAMTSRRSVANMTASLPTATVASVEDLLAVAGQREAAWK